MILLSLDRALFLGHSDPLDRLEFDSVTRIDPTSFDLSISIGVQSRHVARRGNVDGSDGPVGQDLVR